VDTAGQRVGTHNGLHRYTVGPAAGHQLPGQPSLLRGTDRHPAQPSGGWVQSELIHRSCRVTDINWIAGVPDGPVPADTRIRYRHKAVPSMVSPVGHDGAVVRFDQPQAAVTPGQGAVFYRGDVVLGGGWIVPEGHLSGFPQSSRLNCGLGLANFWDTECFFVELRMLIQIEAQTSQ
jgi:tRNA-specific 2-thiouridylase